jgi:hypothetical protein
MINLLQSRSVTTAIWVVHHRQATILLFNGREILWCI